jgi:hypothetical protein
MRRVPRPPRYPVLLRPVLWALSGLALAYAVVGRVLARLRNSVTSLACRARPRLLRVGRWARRELGSEVVCVL